MQSHPQSNVFGCAPRFELYPLLILPPSSSPTPFLFLSPSTVLHPLMLLPDFNTFHHPSSITPPPEFLARWGGREYDEGGVGRKGDGKRGGEEADSAAEGREVKVLWAVLAALVAGVLAL